MTIFISYFITDFRQEGEQNRNDYLSKEREKNEQRWTIGNEQLSAHVTYYLQVIAVSYSLLSIARLYRWKYKLYSQQLYVVK